MNTFSNSKSKTNSRNILGGMGFFEEDGFEKETSIAHTIISSVIAEAKPESNGAGKFSMDTSIDNFNNNQAQIEQLQKERAEAEQKRAETERKKAFFQSLKAEQARVQAEKDRVFEEEINDIVTNLPTDQKNQLLHYQASYKDKSIYQRAELRKKIIEQRNNAEKQQKEASIPSPAKRPSALEGAFEGGSGTQGSGTSNLSAQAVG